tara:strand:- start:301 stop:528 length:228 start_codon:yes stop_codon:yes gene_type:complete
MGKKFRSEKDAQPRNSSKIRKSADGSYWVGTWRFTKISIVLACGLGGFFGFLGLSYISMKLTDEFDVIGKFLGGM